MVPDGDAVAPTSTEEAPAPVPFMADPSDPVAEYSPDKEYEIDRVVSAEHVGGGWRLRVKWAGFDNHVTPEPLHKILRQTNHPDILQQIEQCKQAYLAEHPSVHPAVDHRPTPAPTRVQPVRDRARRFVFHMSQLTTPGIGGWQVDSGLRTIRRAASRRCNALQAFAPDSCGNILSLDAFVLVGG